VSATCDTAAEKITSYLGFSCHHANPVITLRNPADLANWTLPVLEVTIIAGAIWALVHALRRYRAGDPTNLALWFGSLVFLATIEPPLYFPEWFGLQNAVGLVFAHNVFTVQFMYDRLPLYIVAFYPALSQLAYEIVRSLGVFARRGAAAGAVCVALVYQVFYEIFDQLGPQLKWWAWNFDNPANHPFLASVPLSSMWAFATVSSGTLAYAAVKLVGTPTANGRAPHGWPLLWRTLVVGVVAALSNVIGSIPTNLFGGKHPNVTAQAIVLTVELTAVWAVAAAILVQEWRRQHHEPGPDHDKTAFVLGYPIVYLAVLGGLWLVALPDFISTVHGTTTSGTPIGNAPYTLLCFATAISSVAAVRSNQRRDRRASPVGSRHSAAGTTMDKDA
jgi:hypothetical protein